MAANEYYSDESRIRARSDAPLPPLPSSAFDPPNESQHSISPITSPFENPSHRTYSQRSQQSISSNNDYYRGGRDHDPNPFSDDNIPLENHSQKAHPGPYPQDQLRYEPHGMENFPPQQTRSPRSRRKGMFRGRIAWATYAFTLIQSVVFLAELIKNGVLTKTPIEIHPQFNPMVGPSPYVLINMGARYVPCMRANPEIQNRTINWPCPNSTSADADSPDNSCTLSQLCGFSDHHTPSEHPNQWFRFIIPMFLHAGIVHITFNMLIQLTLGREMEKEIGPFRFALVYLSSGIFGFVLGGNFAPSGISSTGASGALFGVIALVLLELLYHWSEHPSPWVDLAWILVTIAISFALGLLPGLDNFSHIGGFLMGLVLGICLLRSPDFLSRSVADNLPYTPVPVGGRTRDTSNAALKGFAKQPIGFFKGRKPLWWVWWLVRAGALIGVVVSFIVLLKNFYKANPTKCSWCKHLSCIDIHNWCDLGNLNFTNTTSKST
ncbi:hypothetical protein MMC29_007365 [Sticta canariensis]|nr:hypothetical protein [Sticta canariensis]